jgi:hypothetical protein
LKSIARGVSKKILTNKLESITMHGYLTMKLLEDLKKAEEEELFDHFGYTGIYSFVCDYTQEYWKLYDNQIGWGSEADQEPGTYMEDLLSGVNIYRRETHTLVKMLMSGEIVFGVFLNEKEIK